MFFIIVIEHMSLLHLFDKTYTHNDHYLLWLIRERYWLLTCIGKFGFNIMQGCPYFSPQHVTRLRNGERICDMQKPLSLITNLWDALATGQAIFRIPD